MKSIIKGLRASYCTVNTQVPYPVKILIRIVGLVSPAVIPGEEDPFIDIRLSVFQFHRRRFYLRLHMHGKFLLIYCIEAVVLMVNLHRYRKMVVVDSLLFSIYDLMGHRKHRRSQVIDDIRLKGDTAA